MSELAVRVRETQVKPGSLAIFWISQAGFIYKTPGNQVIYVDPYLTDCVERLYGFKRIMGTPIKVEEVEADYVVTTHSHEDHFDIDAMPVLARNPRTKFIGAPDCREKYLAAGVPERRFTIVQQDQTIDFSEFSLTGVYADHGELAPDALGVVLTVGNIRVWQVGDSAYRPDMWQDIFHIGVDVIVPPINGAFGNMDGEDAAKLARDVGARVAIPCHFWMFAEHNGNPAQFLKAMKQYAPGIRSQLMTQGELFVYEKR